MGLLLVREFDWKRDRIQRREKLAVKMNGGLVLDLHYLFDCKYIRLRNGRTHHLPINKLDTTNSGLETWGHSEVLRDTGVNN